MKLLAKILTGIHFVSLSACGPPDPNFSVIEGPRGLAGVNGPQGLGQVGPTGSTGQAGVSCTVSQSSLGAFISCPDGSYALVLNGKDGKDGSDSHNRTHHDPSPEKDKKD